MNPYIYNKVYCQALVQVQAPFRLMNPKVSIGCAKPKVQETKPTNQGLECETVRDS